MNRFRHAFPATVIAAGVLLAACGDRPAPAEVTAVPEAAAAPADPSRFVFGFTSTSDAEDPRIVDWAEDPCGMTAFAAVDRMPIDDPSLRPDYVVEFDAAGATTRRWAKPYSAEIVSLAGERLHFRADHEGAYRTFWTQPDGSVGVLEERLASPVAAPAPDFVDGAVEIDCPALPDFAGSDYVQCFEVGDAAGGRRRVAFEGACS